MSKSTFVSQRDTTPLGSVARDRLAALSEGKRPKKVAEQRAKDTSGILPVEYKVLVEPDPIDELTTGGLIKKPEAVIEKEKMGQTEGRLIAVSEMAFEKWGQPLPIVGNRVMFAKYAGLTTIGSDGRDYRVLNDQDLVAILPEI